MCFPLKPSVPSASNYSAIPSTPCVSLTPTRNAPSGPLSAAALRLRGVVVVELSAGQLVEDVRLAVGSLCPVFFHGRTGGMVPTPGEVLEVLRHSWATAVPVRPGSGARQPAATGATPAASLREGWR